MTVGGQDIITNNEENMPHLQLSLAIGDYDRARPLLDGDVRMDGVEIVPLKLDPEEIFFRAFRHAEFDICELSLSSFSVKTAAGDCPYVGVPVFPSRMFRHTSVYIRTDRGIESPADLTGRRVGLAEYQLTANVWARGFLQDDFGVSAEDVTWVRGGIEAPGRIEKIAVKLPEGVKLEDAPEGETLSGMLARGEIDALIGPRMPSCFGPEHNVGWLFPDPRAAAIDYFQRTRIFPIMHILGIRRELVTAHPWLPATALKAFVQAKAVNAAHLADTATTKVTLPFLEEQILEAQRLMGDDYWSYGFHENRHVIEEFLRLHHEQGLSPRRLKPEELFHPTTFETAVI
ncbi:ABC transporter substrate-binding protein [Alkalilacustris brevis]|uniref:ABC transporter substrate-binding protein n=1 Tax=Alkalilacustris brevis TaxID=2026338 RepID=UPI001EE492A9|nr:ABC transporter substrate-binding protein [Alkalilacustris brevis]